MQFRAKERVNLYVAGIVMLGGASYVGLSRARADAPLSIEPITAKTAIKSKPKTESEPETSNEVVVALAGAVKRAGLYHLRPGARVDDAIKAAGGPKQNADLEAINLAARAVDGDQIFVPEKVVAAAPGSGPKPSPKLLDRYRGGVVRPSFSPLAVMPPPLGGSVRSGISTGHLRVSKAKASGPVSLNTGSESQLQTLPGVGPSTAQKIIEYRQEHGGFGSIEEIQSVRGIGPKKFEKMKAFLKL